MTSDRMASSLARPPAFRITWASPSAKPAYFAGSRRASIQVRIAKWRLGGNGRLPLSPKFSAYLAFAASTSSRILVIAFASCSEFSEPERYQEDECGAGPLLTLRATSTERLPNHFAAPYGPNVVAHFRRRRRALGDCLKATSKATAHADLAL